MDSYNFEWWIIRAGRLLLACGVASNAHVGTITNSQEAQEAIARFLVTDGLQSLGRLDLDAARPLYDELLACCEYKTGDYYARLDPSDPSTVAGQIEDAFTLMTLRKEALMLHVDFLLNGSRSGSGSPQGQTAAGSARPVISPA